MKKAIIAASALLVLSAQPAEASFLKRLMQEGAAQLREAGRQKAQQAVESAIGAVGQAASSAGRPSSSPQARPQADPPARESYESVPPGPAGTPPPEKAPSCCHL